MVDYDNMGPSLQLIGAQFWNFLLSRYAGSPACFVHADMTLTRSKVKVMVTGRWPSAPFWGLHCYEVMIVVYKYITSFTAVQYCATQQIESIYVLPSVLWNCGLDDRNDVWPQETSSSYL